MSADIILWQKIGGGIEYRFTSWGETYIGAGFDHETARRALFNKLGWTSARFQRADFRRF